MGRSSVTGGQTCAPPTFTIDASTDVTKGKVTNNGDGSFSYDPNGAFASLAAGQTTTDSFLYTVTDGSNAGSTATVTITITGQNGAADTATVASNIHDPGLAHSAATSEAASYTRP